MAGLLKGRWLVFVLACYINFVLSVFAYKKPTFCDQEGDPFSFLWSIKRSPPSYLFGTIHVPYTKVWDHVPDNAKQAFAAASSVFFELDLVDPSTVSALAHCQMLPEGTNLSEVLPVDLYARLKRHLEYVRGMMPRWTTAEQRGSNRVRGGGLYYADSLFEAIAGNWERKRPVWVMLMVNSLTEADVRWRRVPVLDLYLAQEAERMKKKTAAVEKVEEQCLPLNGLNFSQVLFALNHTLQQHELRENDPHPSTSYTTDDLIHHYNCGDLDSVVFGQDSAPVLPTLVFNASSLLLSSTDEESAQQARNIDLYFRQELIYNRNMRMGSRVVELMEQNPGKSLFFAFGAGHFLGNSTVLDFIQDHGFEIEHLSVHAKIPKSKSKKSVQTEGMKPGPRLSGAMELESVPIRKGQGRRSSRHRTPGAVYSQRSGSSLGLRQHTFDTSTLTPSTTQRARRFNDLWVRMDTNGKKSLHVESKYIEDTQGNQQAFQMWYQKSHGPNRIASAGAAALPNSNPLLLSITFIVSYLTAFPQLLYVVSLNGIF